MRTQE